MRWELYPIPKGPAARQRYGGSYFEESDWWTKPLDTGHAAELAFMGKEVFLLRSVWENFRGLWLWSWLLHWGLYLYLLATLLAVVEVVAAAGANFAHFHVAVATAIGWRVLWVVAAALVCLHTRIGIRVCREFTTRIRIFNLIAAGLDLSRPACCCLLPATLAWITWFAT